MNKKDATIYPHSKFTTYNHRCFLRLLPIISYFYHSYFTTGMIKYHDKTTNRRVYFDSQFEGIVHHGRESWQQELGEADHIMDSQEAEGDVRCCSSSSLFFVQVGTQAQAIAPPTFMVSLFTSLNLIVIIPQRFA